MVGATQGMTSGRLRPALALAPSRVRALCSAGPAVFENADAVPSIAGAEMHSVAFHVREHRASHQPLHRIIQGLASLCAERQK